MKPLLVSLVCAVVSLPCPVRAQQIDSSKDKGTYLGVLFSPVPEVLYDQVPDLPRGQGVVVTHILPDSPAAKSKLNRHDIILQYDEDKVRDCEHFARLIQADKPERKVKLLVLRGGKPMNRSHPPHRQGQFDGHDQFFWRYHAEGHGEADRPKLRQCHRPAAGREQD